MINPFLLLSNGRAVSLTTLLVAAAPLAAKPAPSQSQRSSPVTSSAEIITTLSHLSFDSQSSATLNAPVAEAHAMLIVVFGPLIPTC